ncbi:MAG TPA: tetratricopeptide repeat protein [Thermoanaerobaculia bacterium]|nr:tetratricopeptide repeat protein [Thermoanaerobaculia bacterium]
MRYLITLILVSTVVLAASAEEPDDAPEVSCTSAYPRLSAARNSAVSNYEADPTEALAALEKIARDLQELLANCPTDPHLLALASDIKISLGENSQAVDLARRALVQAPESWQAHFALGTALSLLGEMDPAIGHLSKAATLAPDNLFLQVNLCSTLELAARYERAIQVCTAALPRLQESEHRGAVFFIRGRANRELGNSEAATADFEAAGSLGFDGERYYSDEHLGK